MAGESDATIKANIADARDAARNLGGMLAAIDVGGEKGLEDVGVHLTNKIKLKVTNRAPTGRLYKRGKRRYHRASAPGEPPAVDFGQYRASWTWATGSEGSRRFVAVGTAQKRAPYLEFGTSKMKARPHVRPVMREEASSISNRLAARIERQQRAQLRSLGRTVGRRLPRL